MTEPAQPVPKPPTTVGALWNAYNRKGPYAQDHRVWWQRCGAESEQAGYALLIKLKRGSW